MARVINLSKLDTQYSSSMHEECSRLDMNQNAKVYKITEADIEHVVALLLKTQNKQYNYTIKEAANILNISEEFIRRRITTGGINVVKFGDKPMITVFELSKLLIGGIN